MLGLLSRVGVTTIPIKCSRTRTRFKDDDEIKQTSESYLESMQQEFYLTASKSCLINVTYALVLRVIMLNNNIKILLVSFVHHILSCKTF